jgi:hypothetical protein
VLAFGILCTHCLLAANSSVIGSVVDDSGHPVAGARVLMRYAPFRSIGSPLPEHRSGIATRPESLRLRVSASTFLSRGRYA